MSFYGSVYYQLVDAFYKIVFRNKGKDNTGFVKQDDLIDSENQAIGRKGVFGFSAGNKWINLKTTAEPGTVSEGEYSICEIYHGEPEKTLQDNDNHGFKAYIDDISERIDENGIIQLEPHDVFETYENFYDKAGHITESTKKVYRLPKSDMDNRVMSLEKLVGTNENRTMPEMNEGDDNLYGYVEENCKDIATLEEYQGEWTVHAAKSWYPNNKEYGIGFAPTIAETIGDLNNLYESYADRANNFKSFVEIIGKLASLKEITTVDNGIARNATDIIDAIIIEKNHLNNLNSELQKHQNTSNGSFEGIYSMIGEKIDNDTSIYGHIRQLYTDDSTLKNQLNWNDRTTTTVSGELDSHNIRIKNLEDYRNTLDNTTFPALIRSIGTLENQTKEHYEAWEEAENNFKAAHEDIYAKMGTIPENENIMNVINEFKTIMDSTFGEVPENSNVMSEIKSVENKTLELIGTVPENSDVMSELTSSIDSLAELIGEIPENSSVSTKLVSIQNEVDTLESVVGVIPENNTVYGLISANVNDIAGIKQHIGDKVDNKTLSARISENAANMSTLVTTTLPNTYVSKADLVDAGYVTTSQLNTVETALTAIVGTDIDNLKENASDKTIALLQDIFNRLTALEVDIKKIKESLNNNESESGEDEIIPEPTDPEESVE